MYLIIMFYENQVKLPLKEKKYIYSQRNNTLISENLGI